MKFYQWALKFYAIFTACVFFAVIAYVVFFVAVKGFWHIDLDFLLKNPTGVPFGAKGGVKGAIIGSFCIIALSSLIASLLAVACAFYSAIFCKSRAIKTAIDVIVQCIASTPSVLFGLFVYGFFIVTLDIKKGLLTAAIAIAIMMFATIQMSVQKLLNGLDRGHLRDALALGLSLEFGVMKVVLPMVKKEILSAVLLAASHGIGATAPLLLTGVVMLAPSPDGLLSPVMALPFHLHMLLSQSLAYEKAYATTLVLIAIIIALHLLCEVVLRGGFIKIWRRVWKF